MNEETNLYQIIYNFLETQIKFGAYTLGDSLPSIEEVSLWFSISQDTVRHAYLQLKEEGFITLTKKVGAVVAVQYNAQETEQHIQWFFSLRRDAVIDLCRSLIPMFSHVQWLSMKNASEEQLELLEHLGTRQDILPTHRMIRQVHLVYRTLNNELLLRLVWQAFMFFQGPFLSLPQNKAIFENGDPSLQTMLELCRRKDWNGLWQVINGFQTELSSAIEQFYKNRITMNPPGRQIAFKWNAYEKSSQHRYTLAINLLKDIRLGVYPEGDFLPSPAKLAESREVSVITIRRTLALLNQLGATKSVNGVGTMVLNTQDSAKNCDFSQPTLHKRLLDFAQSLQILALTCKGVAENSLAAMEESDIQQWKKRLTVQKRIRRHESVVFTSLEIITQYTPVRSVREVYSQLLQILLWGYPLRGMHGSKRAINKYYLPHMNFMIDCLEQHNYPELTDRLELLLCYEFEFAVEHLKGLGIRKVSGLTLPDLGK